MPRHMDEILEGMANALWVTSYADWAEAQAEEGSDVDVAGPGEDWADIAPETPDAAMKAAKDLASLFEQANSGGFRTPVTMDTLYTRAHEAMTGRPEMRKKKTDAETFGWYMAMQALGHGVSWFDDRPEFEVKFPSFEAWFDGEELQWSGGMIHRNPRGAFTAKGERMYEHVKRSAMDRGSPRAKEIAARTVYARAHAGTRGLIRQNPSRWAASEVQSLLFDKTVFTEHQAKEWAREHGYHYGKVDTTGSYHRLRQEAPTGGPCRTIEFTQGVKAIVCSSAHGRPPGVPQGR